jgi:PhzF family phenazine biosynthesis protein
MPTPIYVVDAFTDRPFAGNPAGVCPLDAPRPDDWMQAVAAEMNHAETAFTIPEGAGWRLRWFTPAVEVDLCGHATLATAHVLWETGRYPLGTAIRFFTRSGVLTATPDGDGIALDFPALPTEPAPPPTGLADALGADPVAVFSTRMDYLCELADEATLRRLDPDFGKLRSVKTRGLIVTARPADPAAGYDFVSRFFAPAVGIAEDPVTGSAHCALGPYWAAKLGKADLVGYQASRRGGVVRVGVRGDRVRLAGRAVTALRGELTV